MSAAAQLVVATLLLALSLQGASAGPARRLQQGAGAASGKVAAPPLPPAARRRRLVLAAAGNDASWRGWLAGCEARSFDLALVYYGANPGFPSTACPECVAVWPRRGAKWHSLALLLQEPEAWALVSWPAARCGANLAARCQHPTAAIAQQPAPPPGHRPASHRCRRERLPALPVPCAQLRRYDAVMLADDDLLMGPADIDTVRCWLQGGRVGAAAHGCRRLRCASAEHPPPPAAQPPPCRPALLSPLPAGLRHLPGQALGASTAVPLQVAA